MKAHVLPKLGHCRDSREAIRCLEQMGAVQVGSGHFAKVFRVDVRTEPRYEYAPLPPIGIREYDVAMMRHIPIMPSFAVETRSVIIKVTTRKDRGALMVARAAMATADIDPLAPKYAAVTEFGDGCWMGELEVLSELNDGGEYRAQVGITGDRWNSAPLDEVLAASPFLSIIAQHVEKVPGYRWDIHGSNVMLRKGQPVVTDPICHNSDV